MQVMGRLLRPPELLGATLRGPDPKSQALAGRDLPIHRAPLSRNDAHAQPLSPNLGDTKGVVGIVSTNTEKWRQRMSPKLLLRTEAICGPLLADLGYPLAGLPQAVQRVSPAEMQLRKLADGASLMRFRVRDWGLKDAIRYSASALESTLKQG